MRSMLVVVAFLLAKGIMVSATAAENSLAEEITTPNSHIENGQTATDPFTIESPIHLLHDVDPVVAKDLVRVVIEIPTGTNHKWEVDKTDGDLKWELKKGAPRIVQYLGYPGNYGMVPRTLLSEENGGDGDPLDILVLGPPVPRGSVIEARIIGLLKLLDKGKEDDKLIGVMKGDVFDQVDTIKQLDKEFPGVSTIVDIWFSNYKGTQKIETLGYSGRKKADQVLTRALADYKTAQQ